MLVPSFSVVVRAEACASATMGSVAAPMGMSDNHTVSNPWVSRPSMNALYTTGSNEVNDGATAMRTFMSSQTVDLRAR